MRITDEQQKIQLYPLGESAVTLASTAEVSLPTQQRIWQLAAHFRAQDRFFDIVPGMNNLTLYFHPLLMDVEAIMSEMQQQWQRTSPEASSTTEQREITIPVHYGDEFGPDLVDVAKHCKMTPEQVVERHSQGRYVVFFIGFMPGFAYLGGLEPALTTPRRSEPRLAVPAGSVGIGGAQTGIYPKASPGGWQLIGHSDVVLFDPYREQPSLLLPGDILRFSIQEMHL